MRSIDDSEISDLINCGICRLVKSENAISCMIADKLVCGVLEENVDFAFKCLAEMFDGQLSGARDSSSKGFWFEEVVALCLIKLNWSKLPCFRSFVDRRTDFSTSLRISYCDRIDRLLLIQKELRNARCGHVCEWIKWEGLPKDYSEVAFLVEQRGRVVFPSNSAHPDLWFRSDVFTVAVQCTFCQNPMTLSDLKRALQSVDPSFMFKTEKNDEWKETHQSKLFAESFQLAEHECYHRIICSASGFSSECHYIVDEYNVLNEAKLFPIHLLSWDDWKSLSDGRGYESVFKCLKTTTVSRKPDWTDGKWQRTYLVKDFLEQSKTYRSNLGVKGFKELCAGRGIPINKRRKAALENELLTYPDTSMCKINAHRSVSTIKDA